jgi:pyridoxine/pyridoxamine 5'-phosphate oxidase
MAEPLPETLPADPLPLLAQWPDEARPAVKTPTAMALATVDADGRATARMVIPRPCRAAARPTRARTAARTCATSSSLGGGAG